MLQMGPSQPDAAEGEGAELAVAAADALAFVNHPALLLSAAGQVRACNLAAQNMLARNGIVSIDAGLLQCARPRDAHLVSAHLHALFHGQGPAVRALQLGDASGSRLFLFLVRWPAARENLAFAGCVDPGWHDDQPDAQLLSSCFGFTPSEARVAAAVAAGLLPKEIAARNGTSLATVRTQLHCALVKAGVQRQGELVRLMAAIPRGH